MIDSGDENAKNQDERMKAFAEVYLNFDTLTNYQSEFYLYLYKQNVKVKYESDDDFIQSIMDINNNDLVRLIAGYMELLSSRMGNTSYISRFLNEWVKKGKIKISEKAEQQLDYLWTKLFLKKEKKYYNLSKELLDKTNEN